MKKAKKLNRGIAALMAAFMFTGFLSAYNDAETVNAAAARQVEGLTRGLTVTPLSSGTLVSWRYLGTDTANTVFKLYRDETLIYTSSGSMATCCKDAGGNVNSNYRVDVFKNGDAVLSESAEAEYRLNYEAAVSRIASGGYMTMKLDVPVDERLGATYTPNDASVADLDGDGQYELIVKWNPDNAQDNMAGTETSNVIIDAYEFEDGDATRLWRIDLGVNIRAGAHYTQFMVYDLDGDGKAEMVCRTAPGSKDGTGNYVNKASSISAIKNANDNTTSYVGVDGLVGMIVSGSEYLTLFDGQSGKALDTIYYEPERGDKSTWSSTWGDDWGNRMDRFLGAIAYLNGKTPSVVMCRGYYGRSTLCAYNVENKRLVKQWLFDSGTKDAAYSGQGNHNLAAADADGDGYDEIVYGSMTVDHNGKGLYTTGLKHGDALHVGDFIPNREGLEVYQVHEETYGASLRDAKTGEIIQRWNATGDTGRGVADNIVADNNSAEFSNSSDGIVYDSDGNQLMTWSDIFGTWGQNSLIYWDGDLEREVMDRAMINSYPEGRIFNGQGVGYNNSSKANMCITADIFGDWREEIVAPLSDGSGVKVYSTPFETDYRIYTLMHNTQYRCGVAAENVAYNQPPHVDYWLGTGSALPSLPDVYAAGGTSSIEVKAELTGEGIADGTYTAPFTANDKFKLNASETGSIIIGSSTKTVGDRTITKLINLKEKGSAQASAIEISAAEAGDLYIGVLSGNSTAARNLSVYDSAGNRIALLDAPISGTDPVELQKAALPGADTYYIYSTAGSVYVYYIGSTAELNTYTEEASVETTTEAPVSEGASHSFQNGTESAYYKISGNLSQKNGSVTYNGEEITQCLKMETATSIGFTAAAAGSLTMVFNAASVGQTVKIDGEKQTIPADGILTVPISAGDHTVTKGDVAYLFYISVSGSGAAEGSTATTAEASTEATTAEAATTTAEASTEATTAEAATEAAQAVTVKAVDNVYSFDSLSGRLTDVSDYGGAYLSVTGTPKGDGENYVSFSGDGYAFVGDSDTGSTSVLVLPVKDSGNKITVSGSFKMPTAAPKWTLLQIHGTKTDGTQSETAAIRTSGTTYHLRAMGDSNNLINTDVEFKADEAVGYTIVIDKVNGRTYLTIGNSTVSADINCKEITEIRFVTATGARDLYVGETSALCELLGDADNSEAINDKDAAAILRFVSGAANSIDMALADYNGDGTVNLKDCIKILADIK